jgi:hypothetical protein
MAACVSLSVTYLQVRVEDEGWEDKQKPTAAAISAYLRPNVPFILSDLKELQGSSLKLDFNVSTFAKEAL